MTAMSILRDNLFESVRRPLFLKTKKRTCRPSNDNDGPQIAGSQEQLMSKNKKISEINKTARKCLLFVIAGLFVTCTVE